MNHSQNPPVVLKYPDFTNGENVHLNFASEYVRRCHTLNRKKRRKEEKTLVALVPLAETQAFITSQD